MTNINSIPTTISAAPAAQQQTATNTSNSKITLFLNDLVDRHAAWNNGTRKAANQELYAVLAGCFELANIVMLKFKQAELEDALKARGCTFNQGTSTITRVVRTVFPKDEKRVAAFAAVIQIAKREKIDSGDFVTWVTGHGGIDKVRRAFAKPKKVTQTSKELNDIAKNHLQKAPPLAVIHKANLANFVSSPSGFFLNISRLNANGDCEVIATTADSAAIRNALADWGKYVNSSNLTAGQIATIREQTAALTAAIMA